MLKVVPWKPQHLLRQRAQCATTKVVDTFSGKLVNLYQSTGLADAIYAANRIWNCDETCFYTAAVASKAVLCSRGAKVVHKTARGSGRDCITVVGK